MSIHDDGGPATCAEPVTRRRKGTTARRLRSTAVTLAVALSATVGLAAPVHAETEAWQCGRGDGWSSMGSGELNGQNGNEKVWRRTTSYRGEVMIQSEYTPYYCSVYPTESKEFTLGHIGDLDGVGGGEVVIDNKTNGRWGKLTVITQRAATHYVVDYSGSNATIHDDTDGQPGEELIAIYGPPSTSNGGANVLVYRARTQQYTSYPTPLTDTAWSYAWTYDYDGQPGKEIVVWHQGSEGWYGWEICDRTGKTKRYSGDTPPAGCD